MTALPPPLVLLLLLSSCIAGTAYASSHFNRNSFPQGFLFGAASAAYQAEGAAFEGGRGPSIWDNFTHNFPEKIVDRGNGDVADDFYHRYKEDVKLMKYIGLDTFRMSISWSRILPKGKLSGGINKEGIAFYNNVFNELLGKGIIPFVTLFHWDVPQALEDEYGGFRSPKIIDDFRDYTELCFKEFGDRVKHWLTLNEPFSFSSTGYDGNFVGSFAPGRCSDRGVCSTGNSSTEPYTVAHNLLLSHAASVQLYRQKYKEVQKGEIGVTLVTHWFVPFSNSSLDVQAAQRALDFMYGWFLDPIMSGDYPASMISIVAERLPRFSKEQATLVKGSFDFLGLNYYTGNYAANRLSRSGNISYTSDNMASLTGDRNGVPIGGPTGMAGFYVYPEGLHDLLVYIKDKYNNPPIFITENGLAESSNGTAKQHIKDSPRIDFYRGHLKAVHSAIGEGVNVKGYIAWSFLDYYEWNSGYTQMFGLCFVDRNNGLKRTPKSSALWFKKFLNKK